MPDSQIKFSVFTKPWPGKTLEELAVFVKGMGFDGIELPVRPGYQVSPENVTDLLPRAVKTFQSKGVSVESVTGGTDNSISSDLIKACGDSGIPLIRTMARINPVKGYKVSESEIISGYEKIVPELERNHVKVGVQNHHGYFVGSAIGLVHLLEKIDSPNLGYVLDPAHCCLAGEPEDLAIGLAWERLMMVNLKNGIRRRVNGPEAEDVQWKVYWTDGRQGFSSWKNIAEILVKRNYSGVVCLHAEYSDESAVEMLCRRDIELAKAVFNS